jgi:DNA polymerase III delta subunit
MESKIKKEKPRIVASFRIEDFQFLNSKANQLFVDNQEAESALTILNSRKKGVTLRWIFNPSVKIDLDAYQFLCELFGLSEGTNYLTFKNFIRTFQMLNPTKSRLSKKELSRSVFQFEHAFETEDEVFVPPIGGCHREHLSSGFNHIQIRQFMTHGGAHPYFFELLK